jgi:hypothetical protein
LHDEWIAAKVVLVELKQLEAHMKTVSSVSQRRIISKQAIPSGPRRL